ncbi:TetR/AcrR family transcriptional regulator [Actinocatenispora sera]|uniref:TetR family transcriptional regulator n=1 Tax=Actinocatenispora sera TaxID=390989 RepID=A0A810L415_9ACTN|nr:TetR/AcrR family transcriptional regulator [Actinocatenispora sera]BCJ29146.1 TetR family transcriptional regulator [Actinocatenispora sera]
MTDGIRMRADARRNREQIIAAARTLFAEVGPDVPMEEIARRAGCGIGTLYRRFPDRASLIHAVGLDNLERIRAAARAAVAEESDPWQALRRVVRLSLDLRLSQRLSVSAEEAPDSFHRDPAASAARREILDLLDQLVVAAQRQGSLRRDIGAGDVLAMAIMTIRPLPGFDEAHRDLLTERCLGLVLDALATGGGEPLPGRPLGLADVFPFAADEVTGSPG